MSVNITDYEFEEENWFPYLNSIRILYLIGYSIICSLGLVLNALVIVAGCCTYQMVRKSETGVWVLALAVTHLICSAFLSLQFLYAWFHFNWHWGMVLCKVSSYVFYGSMFSTAAMLSLWSIKERLKRNECIKRCCAKFSGRGRSWAMIMVSTSWTFAAVLSLPSLYSRELRDTKLGQQCIDDFDSDDEKMTNDGKQRLILVMVYRFLLGILLPGFLMGISCCLSRVQDVHPVKHLKLITCFIKVAYFVCWAPLLILYILQIATSEQGDAFKYGLPGATVLAAAHCCINPVIYLLVGRDVKMKWLASNPRNPTESRNESVPLNMKFCGQSFFERKC